MKHAPFYKIAYVTTAIIFLTFSGYAYGEDAAPAASAGAAESATSTNSQIDDLKSRIADKNNEIAQLEAQIAVYKDQIDKAGAQGKTLQSAINALEATRKKLLADISLTQKKIDAAQLSIQSLGNQITDKERSINIEQAGLKDAIVQTREADDISMVESLLQYDKLSDFWARQSELMDLQKNVHDKIQLLLSTKQDLTDTKTATEKKQKELSGLKSQLGDQKKIVESTKGQTDQLLKDTKNKEAEYKKTLANTEARRQAVEEEINNYEAQLKLVIDPNSYPAPKLKTLYPPLDGVLVVTQQFGDSDFARANPGVYNGKGHNGVDLRAPVGTPIKAAFAGIVQGTGNTDIVCPKASYGQWVLIKHGNGLTSLYAHLSLIKVSTGDQVETGDLIGYSGNTGYTTGPHLHFGLFVSQGVQIVDLKSKVCSGTYHVPVADLKAYLNPMLYL